MRQRSVLENSPARLAEHASPRTSPLRVGRRDPDYPGKWLADTQRTADRHVPVRRFCGALGGVLSIVVWPPLVMEFPRLPEASTRLSSGRLKVPGPSATAASTTNTPVNTVPGTTPV